jgi:hypothetical protein
MNHPEADKRGWWRIRWMRAANLFPQETHFPKPPCPDLGCSAKNPLPVYFIGKRNGG